MAFLRLEFFFLGEEGEIESNRLFRDSEEFAEIKDQILDKNDDHIYTYLYYTGDINR